jgi:isochorismate hydrolase
MKCYLCNKTAQIKQQKGRAVCNECFTRLIEKRIRKYTRINKLFRPKDKILVIGDLNKYFVESIAKNLPMKLFFRAKEDKGLIKKNKINKIIIQWTADDEDNLFLESLFLGKKIKTDKKHISLLKVVTDNESKLFAKIKKLKFKENKKNNDIQKLMDDLERKDPGAKFRLLKNQELLKCITN